MHTSRSSLRRPFWIALLAFATAAFAADPATPPASPPANEKAVVQRAIVTNTDSERSLLAVMEYMERMTGIYSVKRISRSKPDGVRL